MVQINSDLFAASPSRAGRVPLHKALKSLRDTLQSRGKTALSCDDCQRSLMDYLDAQQPGLLEMFAPVHIHLASCSICAQLYLDQVELERMETAGQLPTLSSPVQFDLSMLNSSGARPLMGRAEE